ncbi:PITH domain-containing protein [Aphelenchoides fujianensis]|nr:PITH domain-containing protein [Aphelenchoides fujianensis]
MAAAADRRRWSSITVKAEQQYNMEAFINRERLTVLNEEIEGTGIEVFKRWDDRLDKTKSVTSDVDEELLFNIPFSGHVKITGITLIGEDGEMHPARLRIFKGPRERACPFEDAQSGKPEQEMELKMDSEAKIDYPLAAFKFSNVFHLTLHFPKNFGAEQTRIFYIGLRGSFQNNFREKVVIANYEARPVPDDHKGEIPDQAHHHIC